MFDQAGLELGFSSIGEIDRFLYSVYGKAVRIMSPADRLQGAVILLDPPNVATHPLPPSTNLIPLLNEVKKYRNTVIYSIRLDLSAGATEVHRPTAVERNSMGTVGWSQRYAQLLSRSCNRCVLWANGVGAVVYVKGDIYLETPDVIEELSAGPPASFQALSWDDGNIVTEFARHKLNDTTPAGIWHLPQKFLLRPKPEKLMSVALGDFLRTRLAGYKHHDDEPYVENEGRADVSLHMVNGRVFIVEVKWIGKSLVAAKEHETEKAILEAIKSGSSGWLTTYEESAFTSGAKQLARYFSTGKYERAYLAMFDCADPRNGRKSERISVQSADVAPHDPSHFCSIRACVDPRKASVTSKSKK
jgi:hypothetical protein